jgi:hypothetical protein
MCSYSSLLIACVSFSDYLRNCIAFEQMHRIVSDHTQSELESCTSCCCDVLSCPVLSCPVLSCPVLSCPVLSCPVLSCPVLSCPVLSCGIEGSRSQIRCSKIMHDVRCGHCLEVAQILRGVQALPGPVRVRSLLQWPVHRSCIGELLALDTLPFLP